MTNGRGAAHHFLSGGTANNNLCESIGKRVTSSEPNYDLRHKATNQLKYELDMTQKKLFGPGFDERCCDGGKN